MSYREIRHGGHWKLHRVRMVSQGRASGEMAHSDGCTDLLFHESGEIYISGITSRTYMLDPSPGVVIDGLRLKAGAIPFFFAIPASEFWNQVTSTANVSSYMARAMQDTKQQARLSRKRVRPAQPNPPLKPDLERKTGCSSGTVHCLS
jgi:hypothetical protein